MWEFLSQLLEKSGFVAVVYAVTMGAMGLAVHALWKKIGEKEAERSLLEGELRKVGAETTVVTEGVRLEEAEKRALMRAAFDTQLITIGDERRKEAAAYAEKLEQLQERRVQDAHATVREAVEHIAETRNAVEKITNAMQTLERVLRA